MDASYSSAIKLPNLQAYAGRIGAVWINDRKAIVWGSGGKYRRPEAVILVRRDRVNKTNAFYFDGPDELAPTKAELEAITAEIESVELPSNQRLNVRAARDEMRTLADKGTVLYFLDCERELVISVEERWRDEKDSEKRFRHWTPVAIGGLIKWADQEPDDLLPFWKPEKQRNKSSVMIHEGAKAAAFVDWMLYDLDPDARQLRDVHPWADELSSYEHWGTFGGPTRIREHDFREIDTVLIEGSEVVYVCDNDFVGRAAAKTFSRQYGKKLSVIMFTDKFPVGFDLADDMPPWVAENKLKLTALKRPATWATRVVGKAKVLTREFAEEWIHVVEPELYIHRDRPELIFITKDFDHHAASYAHDLVRVSELLKGVAHTQVQTIMYNPGLSRGFHLTEEKKRAFNIYYAPKFQKFKVKEAPDLTPWNDYLTQLFPEEFDRLEVSRWVATLIVHPEIKMKYGLLLISQAYGVGKTTLAEVLAEILGPQNVSWPDEQDIVGRFTDWVRKQLIAVNEIYGGHSVKAYDALKSKLTDKNLRIEEKYLKTYYVDNFAHFIACSNNMRALKLDSTDRRFLAPKVTEKKLPVEYWERFRSWLENEDGYRKVWHWAHEFLKTNKPVTRGAEAPWTPTKQEIGHEFYTDGMLLAERILTLVRQAIEHRGIVAVPDQCKNQEDFNKLFDLTRSQKPFVMFDVHLSSMIKNNHLRSIGDQRYFTPRMVRQVAKDLGFSVGEVKNRSDRQWKSAFGGVAMSLSPEVAAMTAPELMEEGVEVVDLGRLLDVLVRL